MSIIAPGQWPRRRSAILDWLIGETRQQPFIDDLLFDLCGRLRQQGIPISRVVLHLRTNHPQWLGARMFWRPELTKVEIRVTSYEALVNEAFLNSPVKAVLDGAEEVRGILHSTEAEHDPYTLYADLREEGCTDYVAWPLRFTRDQRHVISFAADHPEGFSPVQLEQLADIMPVFSMLTESRLKNRLARTFLETYVGPHASELILAGKTTRGSGVTVGAAIVIYDLRGFTTISEMWPRDDVISMLNSYFDAISEPIVSRGGEILKFMGDGLLAVFPLDDPAALEQALAAVSEGRIAMAKLNETRVANGADPLGYGVGLHVGDVMYGNIGSRSRLDFTVIGPAVNIASRLEALTKSVGRTVLLSGDYVAQAGDGPRFEPLGSLVLPGVGHPTEVYALNDDQDDAATTPTTEPA